LSLPLYSNHAQLCSLILWMRRFPRGSFHPNSSMPLSRPFSRNQILINGTCQLSSNFESQQYFRDNWTLILDSSPDSHRQFAKLQFIPIGIQAGVATQPRHLSFTSWAPSIMLLMTVYQIYFFLWISAQNLILLIIISFSSASNCFGVMGSALNWLNSDLSGRSNSVRIGTSYSSVISSICGVLQGSVLGSVLFVNLHFSYCPHCFSI